jgi:flagellar basal-body rod protein FlgB
VSFAISDPVGAVLNSALDGLSLRQQVIADNIANVDTPGYRATSVDFETTLRAAIGSGELAGEVAPLTTATDTPVGANGNNVDLRKETLAAVQSQFQYQVLTRAASDRFDLLRTAANGQ